MNRTLLPLGVAALIAATPAFAQQSRDAFPNPGGQVSMAPVQDVVMAVEQRLQQLGYAVTPDGQFDADLRNSTLLFQSDYGLRPTGNVDLATIAALGIDVSPTGMGLAQASPGGPGDQMAMAGEPEVAVIIAEVETGASFLDGDYPLLRDEAMSAPQIPGDIRTGTFENDTGVPQTIPPASAETIAGIAPAYIEHEWQ